MPRKLPHRHSMGNIILAIKWRRGDRGKGWIRARSYPRTYPGKSEDCNFLRGLRKGKVVPETLPLSLTTIQLTQ